MSAKKEKLSPQLKGAQVTHIRRCHVCGTVNESEGSAIHKCSDCGKHLAPFYYFDESKMDGIGDNVLFQSDLKQATDYNPIWGLSHYWVDDKDQSN
jgi:ribosomal protein S14